MLRARMCTWAGVKFKVIALLATSVRAPALPGACQMEPVLHEYHVPTRNDGLTICPAPVMVA